MGECLQFASHHQHGFADYFNRFESLADPLARHIADHQRRVGEQDSITFCGRAGRPADGLLDAVCPASVQDLAVSPRKVSTGEANSSQMTGCTAPLTR